MVPAEQGGQQYSYSYYDFQGRGPDAGTALVRLHNITSDFLSNIIACDFTKS